MGSLQLGKNNLHKIHDCLLFLAGAVFLGLMGFTFEFTKTQILAQPPIFEDSFDGSTLAGDWWWGNPSGNATYSVSGGNFNLTVGQNNDQWIGIDKAPRILRDQIVSPWTIETRIISSTARTHSLVGLVIFKDPQNWFIWGQLGNNTLEGSGIINNAFTQPVGTMTTKYNYLRIRRVGNKYFFDASSDGINWANGNVYEDTSAALDKARFGVLGKNWSSDPAYTASLDYFRVYPSDLAPMALTSVINTTRVAREIGYGAINNTKQYGICGTDLGSMFSWNGKTYIAFGDTVDYPAASCPENLDSGRASNWRSSVMAVTSDTTPVDGLTFDNWITGTDGKAKELFGEDTGAVTVIPTYGITVGNTAYLYYMQVTNWGGPGGWTCNYSSIATSSDQGQNWNKQNSIIQWGPGNFNQVALLKKDGYIYVFGIPCGRFGSVKLARVEEAKILDKSQYQYFSGFDPSSNPVWVTNNETAAFTIVGGPGGELSVRWNEWLGSYIMMYLDDPKGKIVIREAPNLWGPWSEPLTVTTGAEYPSLYGAYMFDGYQENSGETIYFRMSQFFPIYSTFWMKTTLVRPTPTPIPTPTPTPTPPSPTPGRLPYPPCFFTDSTGKWRGYGDVDGNGIVNYVGDTMTMAQITLAGLTPTPDQKKAADVDGNGIVNFVGDTMLVAQYAFGVISTFPICSKL